MAILNIFSRKMNIQQNKMDILIFVYTMVLNKSFSNNVHKLSSYAHVLSKIYQGFCHGIVYMANEEHRN